MPKKYIHRLNIETVFLLIFIIAGVGFIFITPPGQNPDELAHVQRAWQLSRLNLLSDIETESGTGTKSVGGHIPNYIVSYLSRNSAMNDIANPEVKFKGLDYALEKERVKESENSFQAFPGSALYSPIGYLPSVIGIWAGDVFKLPFSITFYLMRLLCLISGALLIYAAIKATPLGKWVFVAMGLLSMSVSQASSVSIDWAILGMSSLYIALCLKYTYTEKAINFKSGIALYLVAQSIMLTKITYAPILLLVALPIWYSVNKKKNALILLFPVAVGIIIGMIWTLLTSYIGGQAGADVDAQKSFLIDNPFHFIGILFNTYLTTKDPFGLEVIWLSFFGNFGYLSAPIPIPFILISLLAIFIATCVDSETKKYELNRTSRSLFIFTGIGVMIAISLALYLYFTATGSPTIRGIQGRYLIPVALLLSLSALGVLEVKNQVSAKILIICFSMLVIVASLITAYLRYYVI